ncbi:S1 RNA-binding domain-containing protein [Ammoniphilus sp. CFH 90114]|uniref:CvfB family protein n=1 Tax=Ammoniphilus sp. CFH 90114 TaxID=2493665 RepID=UPI00100FE0A5|nr:S1-like domain-containing RNA-binding protein [Ammoniphilus sp. CFH 90114]RXT08204.1 DNA-binding protein [Ammoniphilus sp. CFH 90114]
MKMVQAGQMATLEVARKAQFGYFLTDGENDILLHKNEAAKELSEGQKVSVFLYMDHEERLAATMKESKIVFGQFTWLEVSDVNRKMGVFLDMGIQKELLLSKDDLPQDRAAWPLKGDRVFVGLKYDKKGRLLAKLGLDVELAELEQPAGKDMLHKSVSGYVYRVIALGAFFFTEENHIAFVHRDDMLGPIRLGQKVTARVKSIRDDGRINATQNPPKAVAYQEDAEIIYQILQDRGGAMPFSDQTDPETIRQKFGISKAAFKRALGKLMKENKIYQEDGWTYLATIKQN